MTKSLTHTHTHTHTNSIGGAFQVALEVKNPSANAGDIRDVSSTPGSRRSPLEGNGNPLQYSCLENIMDRGAWWATVHEVAKSRTRLSNTFQSVQVRDGDANCLCKQARDGVGCEHLQGLRARSLKTSSSNVCLGWHIDM